MPMRLIPARCRITSSTWNVDKPPQTGVPVPMAFYSFGGNKRSFFGDTNVHGTEGIRFYTRTKTITSRWPEGLPGEAGSLDMPTLGD